MLMSSRAAVLQLTCFCIYTANRGKREQKMSTTEKLTTCSIGILALLCVLEYVQACVCVYACAHKRLWFVCQASTLRATFSCKLL
mmetsp:Transcript_87466/g.183069  ORF Transcript_87466/g.183069 Transcript_87466/m.183069 type:complete len:85 (+) Transcript_87466:138-392(+)